MKEITKLLLVAGVSLLGGFAMGFNFTIEYINYILG